MARRVVRKIIQIVATGAGVSLVLTPLSRAFGMILFVSSIIVLLVCLFLWLLLFGSEHTGYWPDDTKL